MGREQPTWGDQEWRSFQVAGTYEMAAALFSKGGPKAPTIRVRDVPKMQMVVWVSDSISAPITERRSSTKLHVDRLSEARRLSTAANNPYQTPLGQGDYAKKELPC